MAAALHRKVGVACSGGRDSLALLHAAVAAAAPLGIEVVALHVNHGLMAQADAWTSTLQRRCARWQRAGKPVAFAAHRVDGKPAKGESLEAWARARRYAALCAMARERGIGLVLLAQHRRDQAETFMLQALRGGGAAGLASMPARFEREGVLFTRPWLDQPLEAIEAYLKRHRLKPVEDASNRDRRLGRGRLREDWWPVLLKTFPEAETALVTAARRAAGEADALQSFASHELVGLCAADGALDVQGWSALPEAQRRPVLRLWLMQQHGAASNALIERLVHELPGHGGACWPLSADHELRRHRGRLRVEAAARAAQAAHEPLPASPIVLDLSRPRTVSLPLWGGALRVRRVASCGVSPVLLRQAELRPREGGEAWQAGPGRPPRSLKKQYQALAVPAWHRGGPLVWADGRLVYVPGLGVDARCILNGPGLTLEWQAAESARAEP